jgi:hypothetical protein
MHFGDEFGFFVWTGGRITVQGLLNWAMSCALQVVLSKNHYLEWHRISSLFSHCSVEWKITKKKAHVSFCSQPKKSKTCQQTSPVKMSCQNGAPPAGCWFYRSNLDIEYRHRLIRMFYIFSQSFPKTYIYNYIYIVSKTTVFHCKTTIFHGKTTMFHGKTTIFHGKKHNFS